MTRFLIAAFLFSQIFQVVSANDEITEIDKARAFPVYRNNVVIHHSSGDKGDVNESQDVKSTAVDTNKPPPKDTSMTITGNGGSTNRSAGTNAVLRKRFNF